MSTYSLAVQPFVARLGWTLLHFLWQGALIAAAYGVARTALRAVVPNVRYILGCAALAVLAGAPVITWILLGPTPPHEAAGSVSMSLSTAVSSSVRGAPDVFPTQAYGTAPAPFLSWVVAAWLAGTTVLSLRLLGGWVVAARLRSRLSRRAPAHWQQTLNQLKARIRVSRPVRLLVSPIIEAPGAMGWTRPVVLLPIAAFAGLSEGQLEAVHGGGRSGLHTGLR